MQVLMEITRIENMFIQACFLLEPNYFWKQILIGEPRGVFWLSCLPQFYN